jgi:membrane protease YdiL (CAAX protease family)
MRDSDLQTVGSGKPAGERWYQPLRRLATEPTVVGQWQEQHRRRVEEAGGDPRAARRLPGFDATAELPVAVRSRGDPRLQRRLAGFGTWPAVMVDLVLLVVLELILSVVLLAGAVLVIGMHDGDFTSRLAASDAMSKVLKSASDWALSPTGLATGAALTQGAIVFLLILRVVGPMLLTWSELGFGRALRNRPWRAFLIGLGLGILALVLGDVVVYVLGSLGLSVNGQADTMKSVQHSAPIVFWPFAITAAVTAPVAEETFFRGYVFRAMAVRYGLPIGLVCSAVCFGLVHVLGGVTWEFVGLVVIGGVLAYGYARTGNPITNITAHIFNNVIGLIALYYSGK